jgi:signal transduction histidine kinase
MNNGVKVLEPPTNDLPYAGIYEEVATYVRDLLDCDYALVAVPENDSIRVQAIAGVQPESTDSLATRLISRLRDWGPVVIDNFRMIVVPVKSGNDICAILVGYCNEPDSFSTADLAKLLAYSNVAASLLPGVIPEHSQTRTSFTPDELLHFSRLVTIGQMSACFAHEVTNPLTLIIGHLRLVDESLPADDPLRVHFDVIDRASRRIEEMSRKMLDFSRKRARRTELSDLAEVISDALKFVRPFMRGQSVDIQAQIEPDLPLVPIDRWQMAQALVNLLQNAGDAMAETNCRILSISASRQGTQLRIAISDSGPGITPANMSRLFEPFFTTKGERGTGLGLYITRQVIEDRRGTINVHTGHHGTSFVISLPL